MHGHETELTGGMRIAASGDEHGPEPADRRVAGTPREKRLERMHGAARTVLATLPDEGGRIRLSAGDAEAWLRALNDVRLALGVLLEITEDYERELASVTGSDTRSAYLQVYDWLTFLQETLVRSLR